MTPWTEHQINLTRRQFFAQQGVRLGGLALASLAGSSLARSALAASGINGDAGSIASAGRVHQPLEGLPHFTPSAKAIIYLHMNGGPSQLDTWDYKPGLRDYFDKDLPPTVRGEQRLSTMTSGQSRFPLLQASFASNAAGNQGSGQTPI